MEQMVDEKMEISMMAAETQLAVDAVKAANAMDETVGAVDEIADEAAEVEVADTEATYTILVLCGYTRQMVTAAVAKERQEYLE